MSLRWKNKTHVQNLSRKTSWSTWKTGTHASIHPLFHPSTHRPTPNRTHAYTELIYIPLNEKLVKVITGYKLRCEKYKVCKLVEYKYIISTLHTVFKSYAYRQQVIRLQIIQMLQDHQQSKTSTYVSS
jgi:hypothetical protein